MIGPVLIFDKSFLRMLSADEVFELTLLFHPVDTPLLIREIIGELRKDPSSAKRLPVEVLRELARKMSQAHGVQPADFRKLTVANLCGVDVPMFGQVPVDTADANVRESDGGRLVLIDAVPEHRMWDRWAAGEFSTEDQEVAAAWRNGLEKVDLRAVGDSWKDFARERFKNASNLSELIGQVRRFTLGPEAGHATGTPWVYTGVRRSTRTSQGSGLQTAARAALYANSRFCAVCGW